MLSFWCDKTKNKESNQLICTWNKKKKHLQNRALEVMCVCLCLCVFVCCGEKKCTVILFSLGVVWVQYNVCRLAGSSLSGQLSCMSQEETAERSHRLAGLSFMDEREWVYPGAGRPIRAAHSTFNSLLPPSYKTPYSKKMLLHLNVILNACLFPKCVCFS